MRTAGKFTLGLVIAPVALIAAAAVFVLTFDWNRAKPYLNDHVSQAIGRPFSINGDLVLTWNKPQGESGWRAYVPWPRLIANDIRIGNPDWARQPNVVTVHQLTFILEALALLAHRIVIPSVTLDTPSIALERDRQNRNNWTFKLGGNDNAPSDWKLELREIAFSKGSLQLDDEIKRIHLAATVDTIDNQTLDSAANGRPIQGSDQPPALPAASGARGASDAAASGATASAPVTIDPQQPYGIAWTVKGTYNNAAIRGSGKAGGVLRLQDALRPYPLQADVTVGKTRIDLAGTLTNPASLAALDLRLHLSGASMAQLYPLTGIVLPETPPFDTRGRLIGELRRQGSNWRYEKFSGRVGSSDLGGTLTFAMPSESGQRPQLTGELVSHQLLFADLAPIIGADSNASRQRRDDAVRQPADKVLPVEPFHTDRWNAIDADVRFTGERIVRSADLPIDHLVTHIKLQGAVLTLDPLNFGVAGGTLTSNVQLDGKASPMQARMALAARHLRIKQLFPKIESMQASVGEINGDARLSATGNSVAALLGASNGELKLLVERGTISKFILEAMGLNVGNVILTKLFGDKQVDINCAAGDFAVSDGLAQARTFVVDTQDAVIDVTGATSLKHETLDFTIHPDSKGLRVLSLRAPLYVAGTYKKPKVSVDPAIIALRAGGVVALALAAPVAAVLPVLELQPAPDSACGKLLADVRKHPKAPPPGKTYRSSTPRSPSEGGLKRTSPALPAARDPLTSGG